MKILKNPCKNTKILRNSSNASKLKAKNIDFKNEKSMRKPEFSACQTAKLGSLGKSVYTFTPIVVSSTPSQA